MKTAIELEEDAHYEEGQRVLEMKHRVLAVRRMAAAGIRIDGASPEANRVAAAAFEACIEYVDWLETALALGRAVHAARSKPSARTHPQPVAWVPEDELPESLPQEAYDALYPHSRVDVIRWFPVFAPAGEEKAMVTVHDVQAALCKALCASGCCELAPQLGCSRSDYEQAACEVHADLFPDAWKEKA